MVPCRSRPQGSQKLCARLFFFPKLEVKYSRSSAGSAHTNNYILRGFADLCSYRHFLTNHSKIHTLHKSTQLPCPSSLPSFWQLLQLLLRTSYLVPNSPTLSQISPNFNQSAAGWSLDELPNVRHSAPPQSGINLAPWPTAFRGRE